MQQRLQRRETETRRKLGSYCISSGKKRFCLAKVVASEMGKKIYILEIPRNKNELNLVTNWIQEREKGHLIQIHLLLRRMVASWAELRKH